jgi:hypothetical protein
VPEEEQEEQEVRLVQAEGQGHPQINDSRVHSHLLCVLAVNNKR